MATRKNTRAQALSEPVEERLLAAFRILTTEQRAVLMEAANSAAANAQFDEAQRQDAQAGNQDDDYSRINPRRRQIGKEASYQLDSVLNALIRDIQEQAVDGTDLARSLAIRARELNLISSAALMENGSPEEADEWYRTIFGLEPEWKDAETTDEEAGNV